MSPTEIISILLGLVLFLTLLAIVLSAAAVVSVYVLRRRSERAAAEREKRYELAMARREEELVRLLAHHNDHYSSEVGKLQRIFDEYDKQIVEEMEKTRADFENLRRTLPPTAGRSLPNLAQFRKNAE